MAKFTADDIRAMEAWPASRHEVERKLTAALASSIGVRVRVDTINDLTGEYRIVLQGTLDASVPRDDRADSREELRQAA